ncbi:MAG: hypothetical protein HKN20_07385 [Gemmatimonadetes bacterium]|nr:hypothetical protein [Gemmatimonadota bacterium]
MKKALVLGAALLMFAGMASAQYSVELDLDATLGNGPDFAAAVPAGAVAIDAWITGPGSGANCISANFTLSHVGPATYNVGYAHATGWTASPDQNQGGNDWLIQATDFSFAGAIPPFLHGTASYTYDGPVGIATVSIVQPNGWSDLNFATGPFTGSTGASFGIGLTATEETSWGAVKDLFR